MKAQICSAYHCILGTAERLAHTWLSTIFVESISERVIQLFQGQNARGYPGEGMVPFLMPVKSCLS